MRHRLLGLLAVCALAVPLAAAAQQPKTLRVVMHSDLKILDPIWTTAFIVRNHGYMIYDTLFALDGNLQIKPQMVDTWTVSPDKLTWTFTLRDGLEFHDGQPVTTEDVLASLKRWAVRDGLGQILWAKLADAKAIDAKTFQLVLKVPTGVVLQALAKPSGNPFIMPKRVAETSAGDQIKEFVGSGPFIFKADEWKPGDKTVYVKNTKYKPRTEPASGLAGAKLAKVDRRGRPYRVHLPGAGFLEMGFGLAERRWFPRLCRLGRCSHVRCGRRVGGRIAAWRTQRQVRPRRADQCYSRL